MIPIIAGVAASMLPSVVSALFGSKNEKQAREAVAPQYEAMVAQMVGGGMPRAQAQQEADQQIQGAVREKMGEGAIPPWLELALSVPAYFAGAGLAKAGLRAAGKGIGKLAGAEATAAKGAIPEGPKTITGQGKQIATGEGDPTKFSAGSAEGAGRTKGELPNIPEDTGLRAPFGPKPAPHQRGTPIDNEFAEQSLQRKTGIPEIDGPGEELAESALTHNLPVARISTPAGSAATVNPERAAIDAIMRKRNLEISLRRPFQMNSVPDMAMEM